MTRTAAVTRTSTYLATAVAAALFLLLCWLFADGLFRGPLWNSENWVDSSLLTYLLLALIVVAGVVQARRLPADGIALRFTRDEWTPGQAEEPLFAKLLFSNVFASLLWLPLRFFVGRVWLSAGVNKLDNPAWTQNGEALKGFWEGAVAVDQSGESRIAYDWYRQFLQYMLDREWYTWFAKLIVFGEILVGLGLLLGALVALSAFFGTFMNFNYGLAGAASGNPILMALGLLLVLAWRSAGYWGLDRWLLPILGTPWKPGAAFDGTPYPAGAAVDPSPAATRTAARPRMVRQAAGRDV